MDPIAALSTPYMVEAAMTKPGAKERLHALMKHTGVESPGGIGIGFFLKLYFVVLLLVYFE